MAQVKKEIFEHCKTILEKEKDAAKVELRRNRYEINRLAARQRILKATLGELHRLIKVLTLKNKSL